MGRLEFTPGRWPTVITVILLGILVSLGFWQLDRARQKRELLLQYGEGRPATVFQLQTDQASFEGLQYRHASARGRYDSRRQFLLDNRTYKGRVGYHVLTPFLLTGSTAAVMVNRGWVPLVGDRQTLPEFPVGGEEREVLGRIRQPPEKPFMLGEQPPREGWPYRIQTVDIAELEEELGYSLLPVLLQLDPGEKDGFVRDWRPLTYGPERNTGYAVQWFGLALALLVIYLVVNTKKVES
jgi:surfeit locus 1 family protein